MTKRMSKKQLKAELKRLENPKHKRTKTSVRDWVGGVALAAIMIVVFNAHDSSSSTANRPAATATVHASETGLRR